jgi:hypothetical protein
LNRQNATVAARLRQKERKTGKTCARCAHVPFGGARSDCVLAVQKTFFLLEDRAAVFFIADFC